MLAIMNLPKRMIEALGNSIIEFVSTVGILTQFTYKFYFWLMQKPFRVRILFNQLFFVGNKSLFIVCLAGLFIGMVMAYQTYYGFKLINVDSLVGPIVAISLAKELAPVVTGLIVAGRAGSAMAAEIGTMKVTEQIDALEVMGINGIQYLVVPRVLAGFFTLPLLSIMFLFVGNVGSYIVGTKVLQIDESLYFAKLGQFMFVEDLLQGIIKAFVFGFLIAIISTYSGYTCEKGAEGVGKGTNKAVVLGMISVLVFDFILTSILVRIL